MGSLQGYLYTSHPLSHSYLSLTHSLSQLVEEDDPFYEELQEAMEAATKAQRRGRLSAEDTVGR